MKDIEVYGEEFKETESTRAIETEEKAESALSAYMRSISSCTPLPLEEEQKLGYIMRSGAGDAEAKAAFDKLIEANLKFVVTVANKYRGSTLPLPDLINQGNLGLVEAAKRYDPSKGVKFISYAVWWIRQYIMQGIAEQTGTIKLPVKQAQAAYKTGKVGSLLRQKFQREPSDAEVAEEMGFNEQELIEIVNIFKQRISLESPIKEGEDKTFVSNLKSGEESVEDEVVRTSLKQTINDMLGELEPREIEIINLRYGLNEMEEKTLEELGKKFGVSRERIRQIETRALEKLKKRAVQLKLQDYLAS
jgi:RNA polymerase primary sigma factor